MAMHRHSIMVGKCYRDRFGAVYRVMSVSGNGVHCALHGSDARGALVEREHDDSWEDFLSDLESEVECPLPDVNEARPSVRGSTEESPEREYERLNPGGGPPGEQQERNKANPNTTREDGGAGIPGSQNEDVRGREPRGPRGAST